MIFLLVLIFISNPLANAQAHQQDPTSSNVEPSLIIVIGVLTFMFSTTLILLIYAKYCHRPPSAIHLVDRHQHQHQHQHEGMFGYSTRFSGVDKTIVESLPFFRFSNLKGTKQGLQCAVCLAGFGDSEILRLLPKCKHGFHIDCIDKWLEIHSTCPLCRQKVTIDDLSLFVNSSNSMRFLGGIKSQEAGEETSSIFEIFVQREEEEEEVNHDHGSSKFSIGGSFRKILKPNKEEEMPMKQEQGSTRALHRLNHQIIVSDVVFKNRWSNVSSSDLMFLNSEMLGAMSSDRFPSSNLFGEKHPNCPQTDEHYKIMNIREEMQRKSMFEHKVGQLKRSDSMSSSKNNIQGFDDSRQIIGLDRSAEKRAMSEITAASRFKDTMSMTSKLRQCLEGPENDKHNNNDENDDLREEMKRRKLWFPIAKRTVQWFANREKSRSHQQSRDRENTFHHLDV